MTQHVAFTKMHALGNDFMVVDGVRHPIDLTKIPHQISRWADRKRGVGFDQLLWVGPSSQKNADFSYKIFNPDGQEVGQCGNGARCLARFIFERGLSAKREITLHTISTCMNVRRHHLDWYEVDLPEPVFMNQDGNRDVWIDLGNPHRVIWSDQEIELLDIPLLGTQLQKEYDVNIEWVNQIKDDWLRIRVFERGAGETLGCGSGAVASAVACIHQQKTSSRRIRVDMPGGHVMVHWPQTDSGRVILEGEAYTVFQGQMYF